ncbi:MAG: hypothetical protein ACR2JV_05290, partial [Gaiellales bacterium]
MADPTPELRATVLARVGDQRAELLDLDVWRQILERPGERLPQAARTRLARSAGLARTAGIGLSTVVDAWLVLGDETRGAKGRSAEAQAQLVGDGVRALCAGYDDGHADEARRIERLRGVLLDLLLSTAPPEEVQELATRLGVDLAGRRSVLLVGSVAETVLDRLVDAGALAAPRAGCIVAVIGGRVPRGPETAGLGRPGLGITGIRASFADAERALEMARRLGLRGIVPYGDVLPEALIGQDHATLRELVDATLTPLRATRNGGPQYVETAAVWLQEGLSVAATARA